MLRERIPEGSLTLIHLQSFFSAQKKKDEEKPFWYQREVEDELRMTHSALLLVAAADLVVMIDPPIQSVKYQRGM